jgi:transposase-like protein
MSITQPPCPACQSTHTVKNGKIHNGKQNFKCRKCGRQFVEEPQQKRIVQETKTLIDKLLLEKIPLAGIARVVGVSEPWLQSYVNAKYEAVPQQVEVPVKKGEVDDSV